MARPLQAATWHQPALVSRILIQKVLGPYLLLLQHRIVGVTFVEWHLRLPDLEIHVADELSNVVTADIAVDFENPISVDFVQAPAATDVCHAALHIFFLPHIIPPHVLIVYVLDVGATALNCIVHYLSNIGN